MSDELIKSLNTRINELTQENAELKSEAKSHRQGKAGIKTELDALKVSYATLETERNTLKAQVGASAGEKDQKIAALETEVKMRDLRDTFTRLGTAGVAIEVEVEKNGKKEKQQQLVKVRPDAVNPLLRELGLKPDEQGNLPDEAQITEALKGAQSQHAWAFSSGSEQPNDAPRGAQQPLRTQAPQRGPGADRTVNDHAQRPTAAAAVDAGFFQFTNGQDGRI